MISKKILTISLSIIVVIVLGTGMYSVLIKNVSKKSPEIILPEQLVQENNQPLTENSNDFTWCINNGGEDITPDFNAPQKCILDNKIYESDCVSNDKYFIVAKGSTDSVGSDILVKYKSTKDKKYSCEYLVSDSDFQIKNEGAEYVLALENDFLILDSGTGPLPRKLIVYDLASRKKVFTDSYSSPIEINNGSITYWSPVNTKPDETNCPPLAEYTSLGLGAEIETRVVLTLPPLNKTELGEYRCSAIQ